MNKLARSIAAASAALACLGAAAADKELLIGVNDSLTGPGAVYGLPQANSVQMAADEINAAGGILGRPVEVVWLQDGRRDGRMRRVTDDAPRDRGPVFTPDGRSILFYSTRDGNWAAWSVGIDGGDLRRVAGEAPGTVYLTVSPRGDRVAFVSNSGRAAYVAPIGGGPPVELPGTPVDGKFFTPMGWSRDGARIAGTLVTGSGRPAGVGVYDLATRVTTAVSADGPAAVKWLSDGRRVARRVLRSGRAVRVVAVVAVVGVIGVGGVAVIAVVAVVFVVRVVGVVGVI